ncbi:Activity-regulated cytoskeleton associated protein 1 [Eumeta japonica]|uniref:Activity-regulated cytoskeleton associated protein 1 n=1 Tax=Eumeta variegata TaxID=151549 RepID=A0A4C1YWZ7_EUMVA|nr:Activity-regulated cytoskeleton associated protein 1 [Eumeta japonica]
MEQGSVRADIFITRVRALFAKLPYELSEITKIDIVYGLLDRRIRKRVLRELIHSLDVLVNKSRLVEESLAEAVTTKAGAADRVSAPGRLPGTGRVEWPARAATASSPGAGGRAASVASRSCQKSPEMYK